MIIAAQRADRSESSIRTSPTGPEIVFAVRDRTGAAAAIRTFVPDAELDRGIPMAWLLLGVLAVVLLGVSLAVADRLARSPCGSRADTGELSSAEAADIALRHVGGGQVTEIEREFEHGRRVWKVEIIHDGSEHDVRVDATTGAVTRTDVDRDDDRRRG